MQPKPSLLQEYELTLYTWEILNQCREPIPWVRLSQTHAAPQRIRALVDRGLLDGPKRGESIRSWPFVLTDLGRETVAKIERGLHRPAWLSEHKLAALQRLEQGICLRRYLIQKYGATGATLHSLRKAGYIFRPHGGTTDYAITDLGLEALVEWKAEQG